MQPFSFLAQRLTRAAPTPAPQPPVTFLTLPQLHANLTTMVNAPASITLAVSMETVAQALLMLTQDYIARTATVGAGVTVVKFTVPTTPAKAA